MGPVNRRGKDHTKGIFLAPIISCGGRETQEKMKRSEFLNLCVQAATKKDKPRVLYANIEYYPEGYELRFDKSGNALHRAILRDCAKGNCLMYCELKKVQEVGA